MFSGNGIVPVMDIDGNRNGGAWGDGGGWWRVRRVGRGSPRLIDRTGLRCLATTDPGEMAVWLDESLSGDMLDRVLVHEIGHCVIWSYDLIGELRRMVRPSHWVEAEEWVCNFVADYGLMIFESARSVLGRDAVIKMPAAISRLVA